MDAAARAVFHRNSLLIHANPALKLASHAERMPRGTTARNPLTDSLYLGKILSITAEYAVIQP